MAASVKTSKKASTEEIAPEDAHFLWQGPTATYPKHPKHVVQVGKLLLAVVWTVMTGVTVRVFGRHGIGKTAAIMGLGSKIASSLGHKDVEMIKIPGGTVGGDDMVSAAPVREGDNYVLVDVIMKNLVPGKKFILVVDDSLMAPQIVQNQFMQLAAEWRLGSFDLREHGCIGVIFLDNPDLAEANSVMDDLAQADRYITMEVTDQDTAQDVKMYLANKYADIDLTKAFAARDALPKELRYLVSWRTFDRMIELMTHPNRYPGHMALPYMDGSYTWLTFTDGNGVSVDRTKEFISKMAEALGVPYTERIPDVVRTAIGDAFERGWSVRIIGPHGAGKTETIKSMTSDAGLKLVAWSAPITDPDTKICPVPTSDGHLEMLLSHDLATPGDKVILIDEASRAKDMLAYARTNELIHERSLGGVPVTDLKAIIAAENPPEFLGRKYDVSQGTIAYADRYDVTIVMDASDIPFYDWLRNELPNKLAAKQPQLFGNRVDEIAQIADVVCEWHANDLDNDGRAWISPRNLERMIVGFASGVPLEFTKIWLGEGERAPVPLSLLESRLAGRKMTGLKELSQETDSWEAKLAAADENTDVGMADVDTVHVALLNASTDALWEYAECVARLLKHMPARFRVTYLHSESKDRQRFWMLALGAASGRVTIDSIIKERDERS